jgi:hypothetical protein
MRQGQLLGRPRDVAHLGHDRVPSTDDHRPHPAHPQEARRAEARADAGRRRVGAAPRVDNAMVKALARAFRWRKMLDEGVHATLEDLARAKGVHATYVSRVLRLTMLAPEIVDAILDGRQPAELQLDDLLAGFPLEWPGQHRFGSTASSPEC